MNKASILPCIRPHQTCSKYADLASSSVVGAAKAIPSLSQRYHSVAHLNKRSAQTPEHANHFENTFPTEHRAERCVERCIGRRVGDILTGTSSCGIFNKSVEYWSRVITSPMQAQQ